jgi:OFA family oxalate/formate antiporter-like MFS transporter
VVTMAVVGNWFKRKVGIALGVMMSGFGASGLLVPVIVRLIDTYNWRNTLVALGLGMWALGIPLSFVIRNRPEQYGYLPDGTLSGDQAPSTDIEDRGVEIGLKEVLKDKSFWYLNIAESIRFMTLAAVVTHVMPYLSSTGMSRATTGLVAGGIPLVSIVGRFGLGWLGDVLDKRYVMAMAFFLMSFGMLAFGYVQVIWPVFLFLLLFSSGSGGGMVLRGAILREHFGRGSLGKLLGITMGSASIGGIIGPTVAGWAFDTWGSYHLIWFVFCGTICLAIGLILKIR